MLYSCKTKVYAKKLGSPLFGTTTHVTILANNDEEARDLAKINFDNYCKILEKHHGIPFEHNEIILEN